MTGSSIPTDAPARTERALAVVERALAELGLEPARPEGPNLVVELPGERKLKTTCLLTASPHGVRVEAFVCRRPDEDHEAVYRYLLARNRRFYGVAYTIDRVGDIYLVGRISQEALSVAEIDRVLGQVLEAADGDFNTLLEIGFHTSIRREWRWRTVRGESLRNLEAFLHLVTDADRAAAERGEVVLGGESGTATGVDTGPDTGVTGGFDPAEAGSGPDPEDDRG